MNTADLKAYAPKARRDFIAAVTKQAQKYGVTATIIHPVEINGDVCVVNGKPFPASLAPRIKKLGERIKNSDFEQTMEQVAYSWFNRLIAIRYMELHDYLGHGRRVLSHPEHASGFQILEECTDLSYGNDGDSGQLPYLTHEKVIELKLDGTKDEELYRELLLAQCHALHTTMPFLFEPVDDETELLLPENLTKTDSLIHDLITDLAESDWDSIEVVGWLYQFYISEKKDQVIGKVVKSEDIPAATQLFTPNWIVKYMVQNSLGAQWLATYPDSPLKAQMEYYIEPAEQTDAVNAQLKEITPTELNPEELTLIDPASGSGHILVEAYDLFKAIYLERGYRQRDIAQLILEKNLFGLDIDERAAQMSGFALMMKGREDDRRLFERGVKLNVMSLQDSTNFDTESLIQNVKLSNYGLTSDDITELKTLFEHSTTFGSLIQVPETLKERLPALKQLSEITTQDMFVKDAIKLLAPLVKQAEFLAAQYDAVVANPPYMGGKSFNPILKGWLRENYFGYHSDLFSAFIIRLLGLTKESGHTGIMTSFVWMFISSYEALRKKIIEEDTIGSLVQLHYDAFAEAKAHVCTFVLRKGNLDNYKSSFVRLTDFPRPADQGPKTLEAIRNTECGWFFESKPINFEKIPGSPLAYWVSDNVFDCFISHPKLKDLAPAYSGMSTSDNERFLRRWSECDFDSAVFNIKGPEDSIESNKKWYPYNKGGSFRKWYGNNYFLINYLHNGEELKQWVVNNPSDPNTTHWSRRLFNTEYFFRKGLTWSALTSGSISFRAYGEGVIFDSKGPALLPIDENRNLSILGFVNSKLAMTFLEILCPTLDFNKGPIEQLPISDAINHEAIAKNVLKMIFLTEQDWNSFEHSWDFLSNPILNASNLERKNIECSYDILVSKSRENIAEMRYLEEENNRLFIDCYGLEAELSPDVSIDQITLTANPAYRYGGALSSDEITTKFCIDTMKELVSYIIGCMMGRYSLNAPGLIYAHSGNEGFDQDKYTSFPADDDGIIPLTDKEWFSDDAANRLVEFISVAWPSNSETGNHLEENLNFLAQNLSPKKGEDSRDTIRRYLCDKFYKDHLQTYKKRPIYWLFSSGKTKAFQCLVYLHRYNESTLARMRTEYVIPLTAKLSSHIEKLENDKDASGSAAEIKKLEKEIKNLHKQQTELTEFDEKLKHYADMRIPLDLDDGVKVNYGKFGDLLSDVKAIHGKNV